MLALFIIGILFIPNINSYCSKCQDWALGVSIVSYSGTYKAVDQYNSLSTSGWDSMSFGNYKLNIRRDGYFILSDKDSGVWWSGTSGSASKYDVVMQPDGNLVLYADGNKATWASNTANRGTGPYCAMLQRDRNFVIYDNNCSATWASNTVKPDPTPDKDGNCYFITVQPGDWCQKIIDDAGISSTQLFDYNKSTWKWDGCDKLYPGQKLCISPGKPPIPTPDPNAECGPLAPGDKYNTDCPLNACCGEWGYCGITEDFCKKKNSTTNAPGTTGCYSNCVIEYVMSEPPSNFRKIAYYETWNQNWPCLNKRIDEIDWSQYTHLHYAFADIVDYNVQMDFRAREQFEAFKSLRGIKRILSIGGWGISTDSGTYNNLRKAVANWEVSAANVAKFIIDNNLDGVDIDWEYPGATDIPGVPIGDSYDPIYYTLFVYELFIKLYPLGKTVSIAAPASYWYLKNFIIDIMSEFTDYIVFMTYDLHGQWDYTNLWTGNYLKSHVNMTETLEMLALITHAGVKSNKVLLGIAKYGRTFGMEDPNCYGPDCRFAGIESKAKPGKCTNTPGYLALGEIRDILKSETIRKHYDDDLSQILVYGTDQWVSYLTDEQISFRNDLASFANMGGTVTWAEDLDAGNKISCDTSDIYDFNTLLSSSCTRNYLRDIMVDYIKGVISYWRSNASLTYDSDIKQFKDKFNIVYSISSKADYDELFTKMDKFITNIDVKNDNNYAILYFYYKRCIVFGSSINYNNKKRGLNEPFVGMINTSAIGVFVYTGVQVYTSGLQAALLAISIPGLASGVVVGAISLGLLAIATIIANYNKDTFPIPDDLMKIINSNQANLEHTIELINNPTNSKYPVDFVINDDLIGYDMEKYQDQYSIQPVSDMPMILQHKAYFNWYKKATSPQNYCVRNPNIDDDYNIFTKTITENNDGDDEPIYYVNFHGRSVGVACNAYIYFVFTEINRLRLINGDDDAIDVPQELLPVAYNTFTRRPDGRKNDDPYLDQHSCVNLPGRIINRSDNKTMVIPDYQRDEFPFGSMSEGMNNITNPDEYYISVRCVYKSENTYDGIQFRHFLNATGIWKKNDILNPLSSPRVGPIPPGGAFRVYLLNFNPTLCQQSAIIPVRTGLRQGVRNYFNEFFPVSNEPVIIQQRKKGI